VLVRRQRRPGGPGTARQLLLGQAGAGPDLLKQFGGIHHPSSNAGWRPRARSSFRAPRRHAHSSTPPVPGGPAVSRVGNRNCPARSPRSVRRLWVCRAVQAPVGCAATPGMCTALVSISVTKNTRRRWGNTVSMCRKPQARMPCAWASGTAAPWATPAAARCRARRRPGSGGSSPPPPGTPGPPARPGCAGTPSENSAWPFLHEGAHPGRDWRPSRCARTGPFPAGKAPAPGQQGSGRHDPVQPQVPRRQPGQGGGHGTVSPVRPRPAGARRRPRAAARGSPHPPRHRSASTPQPAEHPDHEQVDQSDEHERRA
jgi:hypothetical protein